MWLLQLSASSLKDFLQYCLWYWFYTSFCPPMLLSSHLSPFLGPCQMCSKFPPGTSLIQDRDTPLHGSG